MHAKNVGLTVNPEKTEISTFKRFIHWSSSMDSLYLFDATYASFKNSKNDQM